MVKIRRKIHRVKVQTTKKYLTVKEVADLLGVTPLTVRNWDKAGKMKAYRNPINNYRIYKPKDVEFFLQTIKKIKTIPEETDNKEEGWSGPEGQLSVDVYQTKDDLIIQSTIAGIKPNDLEISLEKDVIIIRGEREKPNNEEGNYSTKECYWGKFSREIILPVEIDPDRIKATMENGILTIRIPKVFREKKRKIVVRQLLK